MKPKVKREHCARLWHILSDGQFHKAKDIPMNSRMIRAVCSEKPDHFLSTQQGYKLVKYATADEIENAIADLRSRIKHIERRAHALDTALFAKQQGDLRYG